MSKSKSKKASKSSFKWAAGKEEITFLPHIPYEDLYELKKALEMKYDIKVEIKPGYVKGYDEVPGILYLPKGFKRKVISFIRINFPDLYYARLEP